MSEQLNLADMLGMSFGDAGFSALKEEEKKAENKPKKTAKKAKKKNKKTVLEFKLPLTVFSGVTEGIELTSESFEGKETVDENELKKALAANLWIKEKDMLIVAGKDGTAYVAVDTSKAVKKGSIKVSADTKLILPNGEEFTSLDSVMDDSECNVEIEKISELLSEIDSVYTYAEYTATEEGYYVTFNCPDVPAKVEFPVVIDVYNRTTIVLTDEQYKEFAIANGEKDGAYKKAILEKYLTEKYPEFSDRHLKLGFVEAVKDENGEVTSSAKIVAYMVVKKGPEEPKKEMYPTDGTTISIGGFQRINVTPELFNGAAEVDEDTVLEYVHEIYPEYKKGRSKVSYFEDEKIIMVLMTGGSKGALETITSWAELAKKSKLDSCMPFLYKKGKHTYRVENTPFSYTLAEVGKSSDKGIFHLKTDKMPGSLYDKIQGFFRRVAEKYATEVWVGILWDINTHEYSVEMLEQRVTASSVEILSDDRDGVLRHPDKIMVAEFHSHCSYDAFWSGTDNQDELGNKIYGVFGNLDLPFPSFKVRAGAGGNFVVIRKEEVFDDSRADKEAVENFATEMMEQAETLLRF